MDDALLHAVLAEAGATLTAKQESVLRTVAGLDNTSTYGDIVRIQGSGGALAVSQARDKYFEIYGLEYIVPLHRMMSSNDLYAQVDGKFGTGRHGRVYKTALREIEGSYAQGMEPSVWGLPPTSNPKPAKKWPPKNPKKRKADYDEDGVAIPATECAAMVARLTSYAELKGIDLSDVWKHGKELFSSSVPLSLSSSSEAAAATGGSSSDQEDEGDDNDE